MRIAQLELDLDVFAGPFDLLLSLVLREELDLLEVDLAEVVIAYLDHLEAADELDLEAATEFLVLIAALLELKSRLMLPADDVEELDELEPAEAAEELVERMLQYARFRGAGDLAHMATPRVTVAERLAHLRALLRRGTFSFDEAVKDADRVTVCVTVFALLELYKRGEAAWEQAEPFGEITVHGTAAREAAA
jgi:segregation and condensation protein A